MTPTSAPFFNGQGWVYSYPAKPNRFVYPIYPSAKIVRNKSLFQCEAEHLESLGYTLENCPLLDEKYLSETIEWWFTHRHGESAENQETA